MRLTRLLFFALLFRLLAAGALHAQTTTTATVLRPYITSISPQSLLTGADSTVLTIRGGRFQRGAGVVFNAQKLTNVRFEGDSVIVAVIPGALLVNPDIAVLLVENPDNTQIGIRVAVIDICASLANAALSITSSSSITTTASAVAFTLEIQTSAEFSANARIFFGRIELIPYSIEPQRIMVQIPAYLNTTGTYIIQVVQEKGCTISGTFTIAPNLYFSPAPSITRVSPAVFPPNGGNITILGANFSTLATVRLGSTTLAIVSISSTRIVAIAPAVGCRLFEQLSVTNPDGQSASQTFNYISDSNDSKPAPIITRVTPSTVCQNTQTNVTITGVNFVEGVRVLLGPTALPVLSSSTTQIIAVVPATIALAVYQLSVINPDGQSVWQTFAFTCVGVSILSSDYSIYPNPATTALTLETTLNRAATLTLTLRNVMGASVLEERHTAAAGRFTLALDVSALVSGVYMLEVSDGAGGRWAQKVVKY